MYIPGGSPFVQPAPVLPVVLTLFMSINMTCDCMHVCYQCVHIPVGMLVMYSVLCPTTRLPSHCVQVKETRKRLYHSESGVKKMTVGHHLGESSYTIE